MAQIVRRAVFQKKSSLCRKVILKETIMLIVAAEL